MSDCVRVAAPPDAAGLLELIHEHASFERSTVSLRLCDLEAIMSADRPPTCLLVAEGHLAPIGYAAMTFDFSLWRGRSYGHLDCLFVTATARGRGIGKQLFDAAAKTAQVKCADCLEWQTPVWNRDAIRFYRRTGARAVTKERFALPLPG